MQEVNETPNIESEPATMADATQTAPAVEAVASNAAAEAALPTVAGGKNVILPQHAIGKLKEEQRQRGRREAMTELEAKFKAAGFGSLDDAIAAMAAARNASTAKTTQPAKQAKAPVVEETDEEAQTATTATTQPTQGGDYAKQLQRLQRERERLAKQFAAEQAQRRKLQRTLEAKEAEFALRETAVGKGVKDVDYALRLIQRELEGKDEKALATFSEDKFFDNLRSSHPYLFGETVVPATTGTGVGAAPSAPKASTVQAAQGAAGKLDARNMSADEFQKLMRARGLSALA